MCLINLIRAKINSNKTANIYWKYLRNAYTCVLIVSKLLEEPIIGTTWTNRIFLDSDLLLKVNKISEE